MAPNRTKLELKHATHATLKSSGYTPNRTKLELKHNQKIEVTYSPQAPNRTKLELKPQPANGTGFGSF